MLSRLFSLYEPKEIKEGVVVSLEHDECFAAISAASKK